MTYHLPQDLKQDTFTFQELVLRIIAYIPKGKVATYGQVAHLAGNPRAARQVGRIMYRLKDEEETQHLPWQRVVNSRGCISTYRLGIGELQRALLEQEGITFQTNGCCDLALYQWQP